jgi:hypothetical protein
LTRERYSAFLKTAAEYDHRRPWKSATVQPATFENPDSLYADGGVPMAGRWAVLKYAGPDGITMPLTGIIARLHSVTGPNSGPQTLLEFERKTGLYPSSRYVEG